MKKYWQYLFYLLRHKWFVFRECARYGIYWRGITHDMTKFLPSEFIPYANYYFGEQPVNESNQEKYNLAWLYHQKRNKHHQQFWFMVAGDRQIIFFPMPDRYRKEMIADWRGAALAKRAAKSAAEWYLERRGKILLHGKTREWVEKELGIEPRIGY
jgi:hypothetical protein